MKGKKELFLYPLWFLEEVMSKKFYFSEKRSPTIRAIIHKGEDFKKQLRKDKKYFFSRWAKAKREGTKKRINQTIEEINSLIKLFDRSKKKLIFKG